MSVPATRPPPDRAAGGFPVAVLASGRGSNLAALTDATASGRLPVAFTLVAGDKAEAAALHNAATLGIPTFALDPRSFATRREFDQALFAKVMASGARLVVLAGYMRIIDATVVSAWQGRIINIHPSLLPKYRGLHTHRRALRAGDAEHGASVHFVSAELDGGPTIAQARIGIRDDDNEDSLAARLLPHEHRLLVACVEAIAQRRVRECDGQVCLDGQPIATPLLLDPRGRLGPA